MKSWLNFGRLRWGLSHLLVADNEAVSEVCALWVPPVLSLWLGCLQEQLERKAASAPERRLLRGLYHTEGPNLPATKTVIGSSCFCAANREFCAKKTKTRWRRKWRSYSYDPFRVLWSTVPKGLKHQLNVTSHNPANARPTNPNTKPNLLTLNL